MIRALTLLLALAPIPLLVGCITVPPEIHAEFAPSGDAHPNNYHACRACARARRDGKAPAGGLPCPERAPR